MNTTEQIIVTMNNGAVVTISCLNGQSNTAALTERKYQISI